MGNQVNPVGAYWLSDFTVGRLLQEHGGHAPSYTVFNASTLGITLEDK